MISNKLYVYNNQNYQISDQNLEGDLVFEFNGYSLISLSVKEDKMKPFEKLDLADSDQLGFLILLSKLFPYFEQKNLSKYLPEFLWPTDFKYSDEVTFFGGSFNPWHRGHLECLYQCPEENIIVVPDYSPWKENQIKSPLNYLLELRENIEGKYPIYPGFVLKEERNPTCSWLPKVKEARNWLMGDDTFFTFLKWKESDVVINSLKSIYVVPRDHITENLLQIKDEILRVNSKLEIKFLDNHDYQDLSSTKLRRKN